MNLEIFKNGRRINCGIEGKISGHCCPYDAFAIAHFTDFVFDGNNISSLPGAETVISICQNHQSRLEIKYRESRVIGKYEN